MKNKPIECEKCGHGVYVAVDQQPDNQRGGYIVTCECYYKPCGHKIKLHSPRLVADVPVSLTIEQTIKALDKQVNEMREDDKLNRLSADEHDLLNNLERELESLIEQLHAMHEQEYNDLVAGGYIDEFSEDDY